MAGFLLGPPLKVNIDPKFIRDSNSWLNILIFIQLSNIIELVQGRIESFCQPQTWMDKCYKTGEFEYKKG